MKLGFKIFLILLFSFGIILAQVAITRHYLKALSSDTSAILKDNNRSLAYMSDIENSLDNLVFSKNKSMIEVNLKNINNLLKKQQANITEKGEKEITEKLASKIEEINKHYQTKNGQNPPMESIEKANALTSVIYQMNQQAIQSKSNKANTTAKNVTFYIFLSGVVSMILSLIIIIVIPIYLTRPITAFRKAAEQIADKNYDVEMPKSSNNEFGKLATAFNHLVTRLKSYDESNLKKLINERYKINVMLDHLENPVLAMDESKQIIFANKHCLDLLNLKRETTLGKNAFKLAKDNQALDELMRELIVDFLPDEKKEFRQFKVMVNNRPVLFDKKIIDITQSNPENNQAELVGHVIILNEAEV